jgi:hypothetical protein
MPDHSKAGFVSGFRMVKNKMAAKNKMADHLKTGPDNKIPLA